MSHDAQPGKKKAKGIADTVATPRPALTKKPAPADATEIHVPDDALPQGDTEMIEPGTPATTQANDTQTFDAKQLDADARKISATKPPSDTVPAKAPTLGDYKLIKKLGQGGMGAVYKAHQISLDRDVAVKVLSKELAQKPDFVQRFLREARLMAKLDHPNILRCFDVDEAAGYHFLAMEYVEGGSLEGWVKKLGAFSVGDALLTVITIARGLEHAHELGLVHRDIKPDNILLTKKGVIKVADLGLAKALDDDLKLTKTGTGAGTPVYMAPEQARDAKHVDGRCDIYALGVMLYVLLTGQAPFEGTTFVELIEAKEKAKFKPIRSVNAEVPERLDLIVDKMLAKELKHRYATCTEVISELEGLGLAHEQLSFFEASTASAAPARSAPTQAPAQAARTSHPQPAAVTGAPRPGLTKAPPFEDPKPDANIWYWKLNDPAGRTLTKKVTTEDIITLIKTGSIDAKAQVSRTQQGGYRAAGACSEFETFFRGKIAEKKSARGHEKYKSVLQEIEQEEARKQRWKSIRAVFAKFGSGVGLIIWLAALGAGIVGGYFFVQWLLAQMR